MLIHRFGETLNFVFARDNIAADYQIGSLDEIHLDASGRIVRPALGVGGATPPGPVDGSGQTCSVLAGGTASFAFSPLILLKVTPANTRASESNPVGSPKPRNGFEPRTKKATTNVTNASAFLFLPMKVAEPARKALWHM